MKLRQLIVLGVVAVMAAGCVTQKQLMYMSDANPAKADSLNAHFTPQTEMIIRNGDALTIFVTALDKEAVALYNLPTLVYNSPGASHVQTTPMMQYYTVDENGNIEMPVLGLLHVAGLKRTEVEALVKTRLETQVVNPMVQVNVIGAKVSVLGEVTRPGAVPMNQGRLTILEAIAQAGDLTPFGQRNDVLVTREVDGKVEMARVDLRSADLITSPYYYLQQNDVVYVSPNKVRAVSSTNSGLWLSIVSTALSAATVIVTVVK